MESLLWHVIYLHPGSLADKIICWSEIAVLGSLRWWIQELGAPKLELDPREIIYPQRPCYRWRALR
jgi:hypothetical protein